MRTAALWMLHIRTDTRVGKNGLRVLSDLQDINKPGDTGKGDMRAAAAAGDVYVGALLVSGLVSGTAGKKRRACSCLAAPALQNHEWLMMPSRGGCLTLAPNQFPPNCGGPVWLRYQLVRGMAGRQERIKRSCKEKREDGSTALAVMKLFRCTGKQASPRSAWKPLNNGLILPVRSFLCFCFLFGPSQMSFDLIVSACCSMCSISTPSVLVFWEVEV